MCRFSPTLILSSLVLALLPPAPAFSAEKLDRGQRDALLRDLDALREQKGGGIGADFVETRSTRLLKEPLVTRGEMKFQAPESFRREISGANSSLSVSNGEKLWIHYPNFNEVELYEMGAHSFFDDSISALTAGMSYARMPEFYNVEAHRDPQGYRLVLTPRKRNLRRILEGMTLYINEALDPVRTVVQLPKGDRLVTEYRNVRRARFAPGDFEFTPPAGAKVTRPMAK